MKMRHISRSAPAMKPDGNFTLRLADRDGHFLRQSFVSQEEPLQQPLH
jgi:hypothetical protein